MRAKGATGGVRVRRWVAKAARPLLIGLWCAGTLAACSHHVKLVAPDASPASAYECRAEAPCQPASILDDARLNQSGTAFVTLPKECGGHFQQLVILDADTANPTVVATCAVRDSNSVSPATSDPTNATEGPIGDM